MNRVNWQGTKALLAVLIPLSMGPPARASEIYYVDNSSASCSVNGPGTSDVPYCSISAAVAAHHGPGITILVRPGVYRETVRIPASGDLSGPFVLRALGAPVVVDGAEDYSSAAQWTQASGDVWLAPSVSWGPRQVFIDGARLDSSAASPVLLPPRSFQFVPGSGLYVNAGGGNPGTRQTFVGKRPFGIDLEGQSYVTIDGFTVTRTDDRAILVPRGSAGVAIVHNTVTFAQSYGIYTTGCTGLLIGSNIVSDNDNSGIGFAYGVTNSTVQDNESFRNHLPAQRQANGIYVRGSSNNVFQRNRVHDNQDSGLDIGGASDNNLCIQNISWSNGDHGYDNLNSTGVVHVGDVAWQNYREGFSIEGHATGCQLFDCIATDNGLRADTREFDLYVDSTSTQGFTSDYNIFWNSTDQAPIRYGLNFYSTIQEFSAVSHTDAHSIQADPLFANPAAGRFGLSGGSPAIDSGDSDPLNWPATDAAGRARVDDPATPNTGAGPVPYADRGAFEYIPGMQPMLTASLVVTPPGVAPLAVLADASGSRDGDGTIVSYRFDFGDGTVTGPQTQAAAMHVYSTPGKFIAQVTVTDLDGMQDSARVTVVVGAASRPPVAKIDAPTLANVTDVRGQSATFAGAGTAPDGRLPLTYHRDFGGGTPGRSVADPGPAPGAGPLAALLLPNPVREEGTLRLVTPSRGRLRVELFDFAGRLLRVMADESEAPAGSQDIAVVGPGARLAAGVYYYRIQTPETVVTGRFVVVR